MQTVNIADLKTNLRAYLEQVRNGAELIVRDHNRAIARLMPLTAGGVDKEEEILVAAGLMRLPQQEKSNDFLNLPAPEVSLDAVRAAIREERDED